MAAYPAHGTPDWDDDLKTYVDSQGISVLTQSQFAALNREPRLYAVVMDPA